MASIKQTATTLVKILGFSTKDEVVQYLEGAVKGRFNSRGLIKRANGCVELCIDTDFRHQHECKVEVAVGGRSYKLSEANELANAIKDLGVIGVAAKSLIDACDYSDEEELRAAYLEMINGVPEGQLYEVVSDGLLKLFGLPTVATEDEPIDGSGYWNWDDDNVRGGG